MPHFTVTERVPNGYQVKPSTFLGLARAMVSNISSVKPEELSKSINFCMQTCGGSMDICPESVERIIRSVPTDLICSAISSGEKPSIGMKI